ncbi:alpha/beta-hydrolase [Stipitochalara longipes BDJ]|nr:alpha/beta-hydrolase [Stipitochalara longipes BDJ]
MTADIFAGHDTKTTSYKEVKGHKVLAGIYTPNGLTPGKYPLIARFHGGFLITGAHQEWFEPWLMKYSILHSAIVVSPDYRMLPEANGLDIMKDLSDFWDWVHSGLQKELGSGIEIDYGKILIERGSAGGYLAIQSALSQGHKVAACMASYAPIDLKIPFFTTAYERSMVGFPMQPADMVEKHITSLKGEEVVLTASPPVRLDLAFASIQQGKYVELLGSDASLFPMERLDTVKDIPRLEAFVERLKATHPDVKVLYTVVDGEEHGIDAKASLDTPWLKESMGFITPTWLGKGSA